MWRAIMTIMPWCLTVIFGTLSLVLLGERSTSIAMSKLDSYEAGFNTDSEFWLSIPRQS